MSKRWRIAARDPETVRRFARASQLPTVVAELLLARGIDHPDTARTFLEAKISGLLEPARLPGLEQAADVIWEAIQAGEPITVYGDYDADGMTATAILVRCLTLLRAKIDFYVPHRLQEGYGLNEQALRQIASKGTRLVITVDCGIASVHEAEVASELQLKLVITDHHEFGPRLPEAAAIVHPRLPHREYPVESPCGAGVAFKLAWAVCQRASGAARVRPGLKNFLVSAMGPAAIGTVADVVPLIDENRLIVRHGLNALREHPSAGIAALCKVGRLEGKPRLSSEDIAFSLAPRLNAAGRLGQAELAIELLVTDSETRAAELASFLDELNQNRDSIERSIYLAADKQLKERFDVRDPALVLAERGWHAGVIGIVAGRLAEKYSRPVVMIALDELGRAMGQGSARTALGLNLHETLTSCSSHLVSYGGHAAAAGLRIDPAHVDDFRKRFCDEVAHR
ncbi:MAG: single-stranded-DNA-specific exonuclease RecJ, partial [Pseudomonadota bacterium]